MVTVAFLPATAEAQGWTTRVGVKGGFVLASLSDVAEVDLAGPVEVSFTSDTGFAGGAYVGFRPLNTPLAIQIEALYTRRNSKLDLGSAISMIPELADAELKVKTSYLEFPLLAKVYLGSGGVQPNLYAGLSVAFRLTAETEATIFGITETEDIKDTTKSTDFGIPVGIGLDIGDGFNLDVRYTFGLTRIDDGPIPIDSKWRTWSFWLGWTF